MPMTQLALRFKDFDDYFSRLSKATRKDLRRKFRRAEKFRRARTWSRRRRLAVSSTKFFRSICKCMNARR